MMSSRLTFADHDQTIEGGGILLWRGLSACKCDGETCWKKDLLKQICGGRHDNSLCAMPTPFISMGRCPKSRSEKHPLIKSFWVELDNRHTIKIFIVFYAGSFDDSNMAHLGKYFMNGF